MGKPDWGRVGGGCSGGCMRGTVGVERVVVWGERGSRGEGDKFTLEVAE